MSGQRKSKSPRASDETQVQISNPSIYGEVTGPEGVSKLSEALQKEYARLRFNVEQAELNGQFDTAHHTMLARFVEAHLSRRE